MVKEKIFVSCLCNLFVSWGEINMRRNWFWFGFIDCNLLFSLWLIKMCVCWMFWLVVFVSKEVNCLFLECIYVFIFFLMFLFGMSVFRFKFVLCFVNFRDIEVLFLVIMRLDLFKMMVGFGMCLMRLWVVLMFFVWILICLRILNVWEKWVFIWCWISLMWLVLVIKFGVELVFK